MTKLEKETVDTLIKPQVDFSDELALEGSSNELNQNQFIGGDEVNLLGDGVPGYETTGETTPEDEIANSQPSPNV
ncbi:hypothetical protein [Legionella cardiaca]|uniref:Uncharacterized protein n=1 Tax=Legionella cardiaca TaxID=1071983 RepID=A0ABY8ARX8_9GAMM|nr:hypothetical protein [Legionella cardiaca]WED43273.1 hypothetical protein PXX05_00410 [Legionella cardiaca]